jgi:hypothetical protein
LFFVPYDLPFEASYLAEAEAGDDVTVLVDDAHRRTDLDQLLHGLERRGPKLRLVHRPSWSPLLSIWRFADAQADSTIVRAHQHAVGAGRGHPPGHAARRQALGRSRVG